MDRRNFSIPHTNQIRIGTRNCCKIRWKFIDKFECTCIRVAIQLDFRISRHQYPSLSIGRGDDSWQSIHLAHRWQIHTDQHSTGCELDQFPSVCDEQYTHIWQWSQRLNIDCSSRCGDWCIKGQACSITSVTRNCVDNPIRRYASQSTITVICYVNATIRCFSSGSNSAEFCKVCWATIP
ncbi:hypothetical protein D3C72_1106530 [compost metagenome]